MMLFFLLHLVVAPALASVRSWGVNDMPLGANAIMYLDGEDWTATPSSTPTSPILARVPGDLISDLANAGIIQSPWLDLTWRVEAGRWDLDTWTYEIDFMTPPGWLSSGAVWLVFESVKMSADIALNGVRIGAATSQHLRYTFSVGALLQSGAQNKLLVTFPPTVSDARNDAGRYQGCSGGWDVSSRRRS